MVISASMDLFIDIEHTRGNGDAHFVDGLFCTIPGHQWLTIREWFLLSQIWTVIRSKL